MNKEETPIHSHSKTQYKRPQINQISQIREMIQQEKGNSSSIMKKEQTQKMNEELEKECTRLKESYNQTKKPQRSSSSQAIGKENSIQNQYKRAKESEKNLQDYQEKYQKLEENFKNFTNNLYKKRQNANQTLNQSLQYEDNSFISPIGMNNDRKIGNPNASMIVMEHDMSNLVELSFGNILQEIPLNKFESTNSNNKCFINLDQSQNERVLQLKQLVLRVHTFAKTMIDKLITLSVSKNQESELKEIQQYFQQNIQQCFAKLNEVDSLSLETECEQLSAIFSSCLGTIEERFCKVMFRICQVESETFKNYKFKDALVLFESLIQEAHRLSFQEFVPQIAQTLVRLRFTCAFTILNKYKEIKQSTKMRSTFLKWRFNAGLREFITQKLKGQQLKRAINNWGQKSETGKLNLAFHQWKYQTMQEKTNDNYSTIMDKIMKMDFQQSSNNQILKCINDTVLEEINIGCELLIVNNDEIICPSNNEDLSSMKLALVKDFSITGQGLTKQVIVNNIYGNKNFNEKVDLPLLKTELSQFENLCYLCIPQQNGIVRFYSKEHFAKKQIENLQKLTSQIWIFYNQISLFKKFILDLETTITNKDEEIFNLESYQKLTQHTIELFEQAGNQQLSSFVKILETHLNLFLKQLSLDFNVKQIYDQENALLANDDQIIRHQSSENKQIYEEFLTFESQNIMIHQIQVICNPYAFVFHRKCEKQNSHNMLSPQQKQALLSMCQIITMVMIHIVCKQDCYNREIQSLIIAQKRQKMIESAKDVLLSNLNLKLFDSKELEQFYLCFQDQLKNALSQSLNILSINIENLQLFINTQLMGGVLKEGQLVTYSCKNDEQNFDNTHIVVIQNKNDQLKKIEVAQQLLESEISISDIEDFKLLQIPIQMNFGTNLAIIRITISTSEIHIEELNYLKVLQNILAEFLVNINQISKDMKSYEQYIQEQELQISDINIDLALKENIQEIILYPLIAYPNLQQVNQSIIEFSLRMLEIQPFYISLIYNNNNSFIEDISQSCPQFKKLDGESLIKCYQEQTMIFDESTMYFPVLLTNHCLVLQYYQKNDEDNQNEKIQHLISLFQPILKHFFSSKLTQPIPLNKQMLPQRLRDLFQIKIRDYQYSFLLCLLEFQVRNSSNFTKTKLYNKLINKFALSPTKQYQAQKQIVKTLEQALGTLNSYAKSTKHLYFQQFSKKSIQVNDWNAPKQQRKAITQLNQILTCIVMKNTFFNIVLSTNRFHKISNEQHKLRYCVQCLLGIYITSKKRQALRRFKQKAMSIKDNSQNYLVKDMQKIMDLTAIIGNSSLDIENKLRTIAEESSKYIFENISDQVDQININIKQANNKIKSFISCKPSQLVVSQYPITSKKISSLQQVEEVFQQLDDQVQEFKEITFSYKRDIIIQMMEKSKSILNFQNISQSLQDLYLQSMMKHPKSIDNSRIQVVQKCKSALILPLNDTNNQQLLGCIELYRFEQGSFDEELEQRLNSFAQGISKVLITYTHMKAQHQQVDILKKQLQKNQIWSSSLSAYLKHIFFSAPATLNADYVLPILLQSEMNKQTQKSLAFFFQFKDNHIYNFDYQDTFIEEIIENRCILEVSPKDQSDEVKQLLFEDEYLSSVESSARDHKKRQIDENKVCSVSNEAFKHIIYYPVVDKIGHTRAIIEVCYSNKNKIPTEISNESINLFIDQFLLQIIQFQSTLRSFCASINVVVQKRNSQAIAQVFNELKIQQRLNKQQEEFQQLHVKNSEQTEHYFGEYIKNLESYDQELKKLVDEREEMVNKMKEMKVEKRAKLKFLATALFFATTLERNQKACKVKLFFNEWKQNLHLNKIAESAFNKVLELNHKHSYARFKAGSRMIDSMFYKLESKELKFGFETIYRFAKLNSLKQTMLLNNQTYHTTSQLNMSQDRSQIFGQMRGSFASTVAYPQGSGIIYAPSRSQSQLGFNPNPNKHNLSLALTDASHPSANRKKSKKRQ